LLAGQRHELELLVAFNNNNNSSLGHQQEMYYNQFRPLFMSDLTPGFTRSMVPMTNQDENAVNANKKRKYTDDPEKVLDALRKALARNLHYVEGVDFSLQVTEEGGEGFVGKYWCCHCAVQITAMPRLSNKMQVGVHCSAIFKHIRTKSHLSARDVEPNRVPEPMLMHPNEAAHYEEQQKMARELEPLQLHPHCKQSHRTRLFSLSDM